MGLDVHLYRGQHVETDNGCTGDKIELASSRYPDHLFKIGYFRSSYNQAGINSVLRSYGLPDLDAIFEANDEYAITPDWPTIIARVDSTLSDYDAAAERMKYTALHEMFVRETEVTSARGALTVFREEMKRNQDTGMGGDGWTTGAAVFLPKGLKVHALFWGRNSIGAPGVWIIAENDQERAGWYRHALEIVKETAAWVLAQPTPKAFHLHWSG